MRKANSLTIFILVIVEATLFLTACNKKTDYFTSSHVIAQIDDFEITFKDFSDQFQRIYPHQALNKAPEKVKQDVLDEMSAKLSSDITNWVRLGSCEPNQVPIMVKL